MHELTGNVFLLAAAMALKIFSVNVNGLNSPHKCMFLLGACSREKADIVFLQETHLTGVHTQFQENYCGENIFLASYPASWEEVITSFYNEHENFVYGKGPATKEDIIYQYTQLVWFNSYEVGCACSHCPNLGYLYVCQHCPEEDFNSLTNPYTAGPKCGDCKNNCDNGLCTNPCPYTNKRYNCPSLKSMCNMDLVKTNCEASCKCTTEII
ncbi:cysteine-rich venom protein-like isoform X2 [Mixophyes fleayi]|uniref:cysteine-rich venom protein-like isoform X2 n=1 Tax=Mixophyes fleayi TaxID=3061075 RepID=UPI003F4DE06B